MSEKNKASKEFSSGDNKLENIELENIELENTEKEDSTLGDSDFADTMSDDDKLEADNIEDDLYSLDTEDEADGTGEGIDKKKGKPFFKKKEKKDKKDEKIEELNDRLIRLMAEFENYRKRTDKEKSQMFEVGAKGIIEKILPVIDNFERGLSLITEEEKELAYVQGFEKIYKQLLDSLDSSGVKVIEALGKEFDPNLHNAVMHSEDEDSGENIVAEEFQKGYLYRDSVIRHSMVRVVN